MEVIENVKRCLERVSLPVPGLMSRHFREVGRAAYHLDLMSLLVDFFKEEKASRPALFVMTQVPLCGVDFRSVEQISGLKTSKLFLTEIESEAKFRERISKHLLCPSASTSNPHSLPQGKRELEEKEEVGEESESERDEMLVVQFDPLSSSSIQITQAIFICSQYLSSFSSQGEEGEIEEATPPAPATPTQETPERVSPRQPSSLPRRPILFLVHLPPGLRGRMKSFSLDFQRPWKYFFVDEVQDRHNDDILLFLRTPIHKLIEMKKLNLYELMFPRLAGALANAFTQSDGTITLHSRLDLLKETLNTSIEFREFLVGLVFGVLKAKGEGQKLMVHVQLAIREKRCGPIWESLQRGIDAVVTQALTNVFLFLEKNNNLSTLRFGVGDWLILARNSNVFDEEALMMTAQIGGRKQEEELNARWAINTGKLGPLSSCFPFSYGVVSLLNGKNTRSSIQELCPEEEGHVAQFKSYCDALWGLTKTFFGSDIVDHWKRKGSKTSLAWTSKKTNEVKQTDQLDYFHDFVSQCGIPTPKLSLEDEKLVILTVFQLTTQEKETWGPPEVHAAFWVCEKRIQNIISILSMLPKGTINLILAHMNLSQSKQKEKGNKEKSSLSTFLWYLFEVVMESLWVLASNLVVFDEGGAGLKRMREESQKRREISLKGVQPPWLLADESVKDLKTVSIQIQKAITGKIFIRKAYRPNEFVSLISSLYTPLSDLLLDFTQVAEREEKKPKVNREQIVVSLKNKWDSIVTLQIILEEVIQPRGYLNYIGPVGEKLLSFLRGNKCSDLSFFDRFVEQIIDVCMALGSCWDCGRPSAWRGMSFRCWHCIAMNKQDTPLASEQVEEDSAFWDSFLGTSLGEGVRSSSSSSLPSSSSLQKDKKKDKKEVLSKEYLFPSDFRLLQMVLSRVVAEVFLPSSLQQLSLSTLPLDSSLVKHLAGIVNTDERGLPALVSADGHRKWQAKMKNIYEDERKRVKEMMDWKEESRLANVAEKKAKKEGRPFEKKISDRPVEKDGIGMYLRLGKWAPRYFDWFSGVEWGYFMDGINDFPLLSSFRSSLMNQVFFSLISSFLFFLKNLVLIVFSLPPSTTRSSRVNKYLGGSSSTSIPSPPS